MVSAHSVHTWSGSPKPPRRHGKGLVIGAGGVTGLAWSAATLVSLQEVAGWRASEARVLLGTSQGALLVSLLASGIDVDDLRRWYRRELPDGHPLRAKPPARQVVAPVRKRPLPAAPKLTLRGVLQPHRVRPSVALSGLFPAGTMSLDDFLAPLLALTEPGEWLGHPATRVVAVDYDSGERVAFGADGPADIQQAVRASCSVPGVSPPVTIDGRRYVDGAVYSSTSADLLVGAPVDEIVVLAPMAGATRWQRPRSKGEAVDMVLRRFMQRRLEAEVSALRRAGYQVRVFTPTLADRAAMGTNPLSGRQRIATFEAALRSGPARVAEAMRQESKLAAG
ncbi:patatin-like phospholipase family protein [Thermocrispum sp.]|uniref:patatin-like phospholipase family protein n=1 Tax=Thermocrispum sp. TaxID=2060768 RepID=UPI00257E29A9|nr:patatin-like phospholipase family protein [Thermocrispum sp.]